MVSFSAVIFTLFIALASSTTVSAEKMTTPLNYGVYTSDTCEGDMIDQGTTKYLASLSEYGSFCESSITSVDSGDGTMVMAEIYTKINIASCDAYPTTGQVIVDVYLCYDKECGSCKDDDAADGSEAISASLILPNYGTSYPEEDACWGISSAYSTSYQKFDSATSIDVAESRSDTAATATATSELDAITAYWRIFADNSCIGPSVGAEKMAVETGEAMVESGANASIVTTSVVAAMMMLVIVGSL